MQLQKQWHKDLTVSLASCVLELHSFRTKLDDQIVGRTCSIKQLEIWMPRRPCRRHLPCVNHWSAAIKVKTESYSSLSSCVRLNCFVHSMHSQYQKQGVDMSWIASTPSITRRRKNRTAEGLIWSVIRSLDLLHLIPQWSIVLELSTWITMPCERVYDCSFIRFITKWCKWIGLRHCQQAKMVWKPP